MLWAASAINGFHVEASDGQIGTVSDLLFEDDRWIIRWLVVDTGHWLTGRKVLLPLSALSQPDLARHVFPVKLTTQQVKDGPDVDTDQPVSRQIEANLYNYYSWDPYPFDNVVPISNDMAVAYAVPVPARLRGLHSADAEPDAGGDPHLRSVAEVTGYRIHASDGEIGHVESFLVEDTDWSVRYLTIDTNNWWLGKKILISPRSVEEIDWKDSSIHVDLTCDKIKDGPRYDPTIAVDSAYDQAFLGYYGLKDSTDFSAPARPGL